MISVSGKAQDRWKLVFHRYGSRYFFSQAWAGGEDTGLELPKSRAERTIARGLAGINPKSETISLSERR